MKMKKLAAVILTAAMGASLLAGCSSNPADNKNSEGTEQETPSNQEEEGTEGTSDTDDTNANEETPAVSWDGKNITVNVASEPQTMDPALNTAVDGGMMALHLFEGLMKWEDTGSEVEGTDGTANSAQITYGQAESYEKVANEDGTVTYTFKLRDGIKWSDGQPVACRAQFP